jgi:hypothetical protein
MSLSQCTQGVFFLFTAAAVAGQATAATADETYARIRSSDPQIRSLVAESLERSRTFRALVRTIESGDGIVYIERGVCGGGVQACLLHSVVEADEYRILRILVNPRRTGLDLICSLGHELQHAVEVLSNRSIRSSMAVYQFYAREGMKAGATFETDAAIDAGYAVLREVKASLRVEHTD